MAETGFDRFPRFLETERRMSHIYQPLLLKTLRRDTSTGVAPHHRRVLRRLPRRADARRFHLHERPFEIEAVVDQWFSRISFSQYCPDRNFSTSTNTSRVGTAFCMP